MTGEPPPLIVLSGASGGGKSTLVPLLVDRLAGECLVFDVDWLIDPLRNRDGDVDWVVFRNAWLHVAAGVARNRLPTLLAGPLIPEHLDALPGRGLIGQVHFGVLDCPDDVRRERIEARPAWRARDIEEQVEFGRWLRTNLSPVFDTGAVDAAETADAVAGWIREVVPVTGQ